MAGIYIHIPFCARRCGYCDFFSSTALGQRGVVLSAIREEIAARAGVLAGETVETVYVGGGTPSLCTAGDLGALLGAVGDNFETDLKEVTVEVNPDDITPGYLEALLDAGFDRLSMGVQSFDDRCLEFMGRRHDAARAATAVVQARDAGFDNISIDLIYGVPGMEMESWGSSVDRAVALGVEHISAYHLTIEEGTRFGERMRRGELLPVEEQVSCDHYGLLCDRLGRAGYEHYEISNFALPGRRALHNGNYWKGIPYLGVGPSAHSYHGRTREWNASSLAVYLGGEGRFSEELSDTDVYNELVMLSLRTADGLSREAVAGLCGAVRGERFSRTARDLAGDGLLELSGGAYRIPEDKYLLSDMIIDKFFEV